MLDPAQPAPGDLVQVTYYWSALRPMAEDYQIFVHGDAVGSKESRLHGDHWPAKGKYGTAYWQEGEYIIDRFSVRVPPAYGAKHLGLFTGLYKGNYRVPLSVGGQKVGTSDNRSRAVDIYFR